MESLEAQKERKTSESGPAQPVRRLRKIDCNGNPEIADRRIEHRGGRRDDDDVSRAG